MPIKVLHIYKDFYPVLGGIENHIKLLTKELAKDKNFQIQVLVTNLDYSKKIEFFDNIEVIKTKRIFHLASTPVSLEMFSYIKKLKADIIHLHFPYPPGEFGTWLFQKNCKIIITYHSDVVKQKIILFFYRPFLKKILERVDLILVQSPPNISASVFLPFFKEKIEVVPLGIDLELFKNQEEKRISKIKEKFKGEIVLFVGKLRYYKGLNYLLDSAKEVEAKFLIIGKGPQEEILKTQVKKNNLSEKVFFLEEVSNEELASYYYASDLLVLPSCEKSEAYGLVLLEAMACGIPVISTELGTGTSWVNQNGESGLVVPPKNPKALAEAINLLLSNPDLRKKFGEAGKKRVHSNFTKEIMAEKVKNLYFKILQR